MARFNQDYLSSQRLNTGGSPSLASNNAFSGSLFQGTSSVDAKQYKPSRYNAPKLAPQPDNVGSIVTARGLKDIYDGFNSAALKAAKDQSILESQEAITQYNDMLRFKEFGDDQTPGYYDQMGKAAIGGYSDFVDSVNDITNQILSGLSPAARAEAFGAIDLERTRTLDSAVKHRLQQKGVWGQNVQSNRLEQYEQNKSLTNFSIHEYTKLDMELNQILPNTDPGTEIIKRQTRDNIILNSIEQRLVHPGGIPTIMDLIKNGGIPKHLIADAKDKINDSLVASRATTNFSQSQTDRISGAIHTLNENLAFETILSGEILSQEDLVKLVREGKIDSGSVSKILKFQKEINQEDIDYDSGEFLVLLEKINRFSGTSKDDYQTLKNEVFIFSASKSDKAILLNKLSTSYDKALLGKSKKAVSQIKSIIGSGAISLYKSVTEDLIVTLAIEAEDIILGGGDLDAWLSELKVNKGKNFARAFFTSEQLRTPEGTYPLSLEHTQKMAEQAGEQFNSGEFDEETYNQWKIVLIKYHEIYTNLRSTDDGKE